MNENYNDKITEILEAQVRRLGLISQNKIDIEDIEHDRTREEILEITDRILEGSDVPEPGEERVSYLASVLRLMIEERFESGMSCIYDLFDASMASLGDEILEYEDFERYEAVIEMLDDFSNDQLDSAFDYALKFRNSDEGLALTQNHVQLSEMADPISEIRVVDSESTREVVEIYSKCMDVCDNASTLLVALKRIDEGENPMDADLSGMKFGAKLNELLSSRCERLVEGIDKDLRNSLSHGDLVVDPYDERVYDASTKKSWTYEKLEEKTKTCVSISKFMASLGLIVTSKWIRIQGVDYS